MNALPNTRPFQMRAANERAALAQQVPAAVPVKPSVPVPQLPPSEAPMQGPAHKQLANQLHLTHGAHNALSFPLSQFQGEWTGVGFNMIFRPRPFDATKTKFDFANPNGPNDNILELNLTKEQWSFGQTLGSIANRGLGAQQDIFLGGIPYLQTVQNVTNPLTGLGDKDIKNPDEPDAGLHFEPGVWLFCPPSGPNAASIARMGCVPHGTSFTAQGLVPAETKTDKTPLGGTQGKPIFEKLDTTPFRLHDPDSKVEFADTFKSMTADVNTLREPSNLGPFAKKGTINPDIIKNPNLVLKAVTDLQRIQETISFSVSTGPPQAQLNGGGTSNISFLAGPQARQPFPPPSSTTSTTKTASALFPTNSNPGLHDNPNAHADFLTNRWWIYSVLYDVPVGTTGMKPNETRELSAVLPPNCRAPAPRFHITAAREIKPDETLQVPGFQMQYSQTVNLNFGPREIGVLTWPHVSVATLVPTRAQPFTVSSLK